MKPESTDTGKPTFEEWAATPEGRAILVEAVGEAERELARFRASDAVSGGLFRSTGLSEEEGDDHG